MAGVAWQTVNAPAVQADEIIESLAEVVRVVVWALCVILKDAFVTALVTSDCPLPAAEAHDDVPLINTCLLKISRVLCVQWLFHGLGVKNERPANRVKCDRWGRTSIISTCGK